MEGSRLTNGKEKGRGYKMCRLLRGYDVVQVRTLLKECGVNLLC